MASTLRATPLFPPGRKRLLLIASTGGHLSQLVRIAEREGAAEDSVWVTFDSPQSRSLLAGRRVVWVDYIAPRDLAGTVRAYRRIDSELDPADFDGALSTGAAVAVAGLAWARLNRVPSVYVESVSRTDGPSLSGRIVRALRLARTHTQHARWASRGWTPVRSVLSDVTREASDTPLHPDAPLRILVTLGTIRPYRFDALVDQVLAILAPGDEVVWQLGETTRSGLPGASHRLLSANALLQEARSAHVVITHSGVGTILQLLDHGISPIVVPRRRERGEHIDDHQLQIWRLLHDSDVGHPVEVGELTRDVLLHSAACRTVSRAEG